MYFRLRYITTDWAFGNAEIRISNLKKQIDVVIKKRETTDIYPTREEGDAVAVVTCRAEIPARLEEQAFSFAAAGGQ